MNNSSTLELRCAITGLLLKHKIETYQVDVQGLSCRCHDVKVCARIIPAKVEQTKVLTLHFPRTNARYMYLNIGVLMTIGNASTSKPFSNDNPTYADIKDSANWNNGYGMNEAIFPPNVFAFQNKFDTVTIVTLRDNSTPTQKALDDLYTAIARGFISIDLYDLLSSWIWTRWNDEKVRLFFEHLRECVSKNDENKWFRIGSPYMLGLLTQERIMSNRSLSPLIIDSSIANNISKSVIDLTGSE